MALYDSAWRIADRTADTLLIAAAIYAKGRAYDAINNNAQKTIDYFAEAARLYSGIPGYWKKAMYIRHLLAHSYDKVQDSGNCVRVLEKLYGEILDRPDSIKKQLAFIPEMALVSTVVKNYALAGNILKNLTRREWIRNDPSEYDYLDHYYLTMARIDVYSRKFARSPYIDSFERAIKRRGNPSDSIYYSYELYGLYSAAGNTGKADFYMQLNNAAGNRFRPPDKLRETIDKMEKMELAALEERQRVTLEEAATRQKSIYILVGLLGVNAT